MAKTEKKISWWSASIVTLLLLAAGAFGVWKLNGGAEPFEKQAAQPNPEQDLMVLTQYPDHFVGQRISSTAQIEEVVDERMVWLTDELGRQHVLAVILPLETLRPGQAVTVRGTLYRADDTHTLNTDGLSDEALALLNRTKYYMRVDAIAPVDESASDWREDSPLEPERVPQVVN